MACSVVIADAQRLVRESLVALLESRGGLEVVGQAEDGRGLIELCLQHAPDLAVADAHLPRISGIEALRRLRSSGARPHFVLISSSDSLALVRCALLAGASGFVPRSAAAAELLEAIAACRDGRPFYTCAGRGSIADVLSASANDAEPAALSLRQAQVLRLVAEGFSTRQIAGELGISFKTAQAHRMSLMKKLGAHKASELVRYAIRSGLVQA